MAQTVNHLNAERSTLELARQGEPDAIATLLNRSLNPRGIGVQAKLDQGCLHLLLEAPQLPSQQEWVPFIQQGITNLGAPPVQRVMVYGRQSGAAQVAWQQAVPINRLATPYNPAIAPGGVPVTQFELGTPDDEQIPQIAIENKILQITPQGGVVTLTPQRKSPFIRTRPAPQPEQTCQSFPDLINRSTEVNTAINALRLSQPVELCGEAGQGKTALLRSLAYHPQVRELAPEGVFYFLAGNQPLEDLLQSLFDAFFEYENDRHLPQKPTDDEIRYVLRGKRSLILLDDLNLPAQTVGQLVGSLPSLNFIVASSDRRVWGESQFIPVNGLPLSDALQLLERHLNWAIAPEEREAAESLCTYLQGNPLQIAQAAAIVREKKLTLPVLVQQLQSGTPLEMLVLRSCTALPEPERRAMAALGVLGDTPIRLQHLAGLTGSANPQSVLDTLLSLNLVVSDGNRYTLAHNLVSPLRQFWNLSQWVQPIIRYFVSWTKQNAALTQTLVQEGNLLNRMMDLAAQVNLGSEIVTLATLSDQAFAVEGYWGTWEQLWQRALQAAQALGDQGAIALALHQLGTRALCLDDPFTAHTYLSQALHLRETIGDASGAALSRHNLDMLLNPLPYPAMAQPEPQPFQSQPEAEPAERRKDFALPPAAQVALIGVLFLGLGSFAAWQIYRNRANFTISPDRLDFGTQTLNKASQARSITVQNTDDRTLEFAGIQLGGANASDFQFNETCTKGAIAPNQSCKIDVIFTPQQQGDRIADLTLSDRAGTARRTIPLSGSSPTSSDGNNAGGNTVILQFNPGSVNFGDLPIGQSTDPRRIVLTNASSFPVTIQTVNLAGDAKGDFQLYQECTGGALNPNQSCPIQVSFNPSTSGSRTASIAITDSNNGVWNLPIQGNGISTTPQVPVIGINPGGFDFGNQTLQNPSRETIFTISNSGAQPLTIQQVRLDGDGAEDFVVWRNTCQREPVDPNQTCQLGVYFSPQSTGIRRSVLRVFSNDPKGTVDVPLSGNGVQAVVPRINVTPTNLEFGSIELENSSGMQVVNISNTGSGPLQIGEIFTGGNGDFLSDRSTPIGVECSNISLAPGQSCSFGVVFIPQVEGDRLAQVTIPNNSPRNAVGVILRGKGTVRRFPSLSLNPTSLSFGNQTQGSNSAPQTVNLSNAGSAPLQLGNITFNGSNPYDFTSSNSGEFGISCANTTLNPGQTCAIQIFFSPMEAGDRSAQLIIPSNDPNRSATVNLYGTGTAAVTPLPEPVSPRPVPLPGTPLIQPR